MRRKFDARVALITGATGGIGNAIAEALAADGVGVAIGYSRNEEGARELAARLERGGGVAFPCQLDQRDLASIELCVESVASRFGRLDILINNAAWNVGIEFSDLDAMLPDYWDRIHETNLRGPFYLARAAAPLLRASGAGHIVNIASNGGLAPSSSSIAYSASKAGLIHLTRCLAVALAPEVAVNCIAPGVVNDTAMARRMPPDVIASETAAAVLGRTAAKEDIARQIVTLCNSTSITGQTLVIDGGMLIAMC